jgi:hypothetical protein
MRASNSAVKSGELCTEGVGIISLMNDGRGGVVVLCHYDCWLELLVFDNVSIKCMSININI